ncbi:hypothetical protein, partial [Shewanella sp. GutDb-MelDb]|uniref:hypothetical protein n=1 Tax=Shewanella sp. GutDb-MelDb TaxID=2058316 RepID=UPI000CB971C9
LTLPALLSSNQSYAADALVEYCENCSTSQMESIIRAKFKYTKSCPYYEEDECYDAEFKEYNMFFSDSAHTRVTKYEIEHGKYFLEYSKDNLTPDEIDFFYELRELRRQLLEDAASGDNLFPHSAPLKSNNLVSTYNSAGVGYSCTSPFAANGEFNDSIYDSLVKDRKVLNSMETILTNRYNNRGYIDRIVDKVHSMAGWSSPVIGLTFEKATEGVVHYENFADHSVGVYDVTLKAVHGSPSEDFAVQLEVDLLRSKNSSGQSLSGFVRKTSRGYQVFDADTLASMSVCDQQEVTGDNEMTDEFLDDPDEEAFCGRVGTTTTMRFYVLIGRDPSGMREYGWMYVEKEDEDNNDVDDADGFCD